MEWPVIEILPWGELTNLPRFMGGRRWAVSGVYFIWNRDGNLVYIGSAKRLNTRLPAHKREWYFGHATVLEVPSPWHAAVEIVYIEHYKPSENCNHNARGSRGQKSADGWGKVSRDERRIRAEANSKKHASI